MKRVYLYLAAGFAVVALAAGAVVARGGASAEAQDSRASRGIVHLSTQAVDLPNGTWTNIPLQVTLPSTGTYSLDADVRGRLSGSSPGNAYITARLWNVTTQSVVPESERIVYQIISPAVGGNQTAPISELIDVNGPTKIQLQARRNDAQGAAPIAQIYSDANGYTSLRYETVRP